MRQRKAPWEGYFLQRSTIFFIAFFLLAMFLLQTGIFLADIMGYRLFSLGIANTAHIAGGTIGALLGSSKLFAMKQEL